MKCYIYGAGAQYNRLSSYLAAYKSQIEILRIVTSQRQAFSVLDGIPCICPDEMELDGIDYVIIAVEKWREVYENLNSLGLPDEKILRSSVFGLPNFQLEKYLELKRNNVSILANSCLAGMVYKELGLKALSPTINAICVDYIEFLSDYRHYLGMDMEEETAERSPVLGMVDYPMGSIDHKVRWIFPHVTSAGEGIRKWNEKRKEIHYDNIAAFMIIQRDEEAYRFDQLPIRKKLGIYYKDLGLKSVICCSDWNNRKLQSQYDFNYLRYVHRYLTNGEGPGRVDWIRFLLGEEAFLRYHT